AQREYARARLGQQALQRIEREGVRTFQRYHHDRRPGILWPPREHYLVGWQRTASWARKFMLSTKICAIVGWPMRAFALATIRSISLSTSTILSAVKSSPSSS